jgi:hypothetical protein
MGGTSIPNRVAGEGNLSATWTGWEGPAISVTGLAAVFGPEDRLPGLDPACPHSSPEPHHHPTGQEPRQVDEQDRQGLVRLRPGLPQPASPWPQPHCAVCTRIYAHLAGLRDTLTPTLPGQYSAMFAELHLREQ